MVHDLHMFKCAYHGISVTAVCCIVYWIYTNPRFVLCRNAGIICFCSIQRIVSWLKTHVTSLKNQTFISLLDWIICNWALNAYQSAYLKAYQSLIQGWMLILIFFFLFGDDTSCCLLTDANSSVDSYGKNTVKFFLISILSHRDCLFKKKCKITEEWKQCCWNYRWNEYLYLLLMRHE